MKPLKYDCWNEKLNKYFDTKKELNPESETVARTFDKVDRLNFHPTIGINTRFNVLYWDGGKLRWDWKPMRLVDVSDFDNESGFIKSLIIKSAITSYGGKIFVEGWWKTIDVYAYKVEWIPKELVSDKETLWLQ